MAGGRSSDCSASGCHCCSWPTCRETDAFADLSVVTLVVTAVLGVALGVGWGVATDVAVARTDDDALGLPVSTARILITGFAIPLTFLILLFAPMVLIRFWRPGVRESLDGFVIGALGRSASSARAA